MIKARANNVVIFGLSKKNIKRLQQGKPIAFEGKELGMKDFRFFIFAGDTEESMMKDMEEFIRPELR